MADFTGYLADAAAAHLTAHHVLITAIGLNPEPAKPLAKWHVERII